MRILLIFSEAPGSSPLAMRQEREALLELFRREVLTKRRVEVDVMAFGVTRARLREQIKSRDGYHIVHWSGHGHVNTLEIRGEDGTRDRIGGEELVQIFVEAGGFIPRLFFLSACLSGSFLNVVDWKTFERAMNEANEAAGAKPAAEGNKDTTRELSKVLDESTGYTGTALKLREAGVPEVIAMRYEVGDVYARELAVCFYKRLLGDHNAPFFRRLRPGPSGFEECCFLVRP